MAKTLTVSTIIWTGMIFIFSFLSIFPPELYANFSGHRLPFQANQTVIVTKKDGEEHKNMIDFAFPGYVSGDVCASKPGKVVYVKESSPDNNHGIGFIYYQKANVVVIQHSDNEYSWYYHLAYNKVYVSVGDLVGYGTKIATAGMTGWATGIHLHFMVSSSWSDYSCTTSECAPRPSEGTVKAVDFVEASWNDLVVGKSYTSQNTSTQIPSSGPITLTFPNGSESWIVGSTQNITWTYQNVTNVNLEYSTNNGSSWTTIVTSTSAAAGSYAWMVPNTPSMQCLVKISDASNAIMNDVSRVVFTIEGKSGVEENTIPMSFSLLQNYPNPFNPSTTISYRIPEKTKVNLTVYDINDQIVKTLVDTIETAGYHSVIWDGTDDSGKKVASGMYLYRLNAVDFSKTQKMTFIR